MKERVSSKRTPAGRRIVRALKEALAIERGELAPGAADRTVVTARVAVAAPAPEYSAGDVRAIRSRLELSQSVFAQVLNVSADTVRAWEQGKKPPSGAAARLLEIAARHPEWILTSVGARV